MNCYRKELARWWVPTLGVFDKINPRNPKLWSGSMAGDWRDRKWNRKVSARAHHLRLSPTSHLCMLAEQARERTAPSTRVLMVTTPLADPMLVQVRILQTGSHFTGSQAQQRCSSTVRIKTSRGSLLVLSCLHFFILSNVLSVPWLWVPSFFLF